MEYRYEILNDGSPMYALYFGNTILHRMDAVSFLFDKGSNTLLKHGNQDMIIKVARETARSYVSMGANEMAENLVMLSGKFDLDEINRVISTAGYIGQFYRQVMAYQSVQIRPEKSKFDHMMGDRPDEHQAGPFRVT